MSDAENAAARAASELDAWWTAEAEKAQVARAVKDPLYHYTDAAGLSGIFEKEQIWFTSILHQNDPTELKYGLGLAFEELQLLADANRDSVGKAIGFFSRMIKDVLSKPLKHEFYVASFSEDADELGQWRGYGDDGRGFSIGFAPSVFEERQQLIHTPLDAIFVQKVIYDQELARQRSRPAMTQAVEIIRREIESGAVRDVDEGNKLLKAIAPVLSVDILYGAIGTKHRAYRAEKETRLILVNDPKTAASVVDIRSSGARIVPFVKVDLPIRRPGSIVEIILGPDPDTGAEHAVKSMLAKYGLDDAIKVHRSEIPYRSRR